MSKISKKFLASTLFVAITASCTAPAPTKPTDVKPSSGTNAVTPKPGTTTKSKVKAKITPASAKASLSAMTVSNNVFTDARNLFNKANLVKIPGTKSGKFETVKEADFTVKSTSDTKDGGNDVNKREYSIKTPIGLGTLSLIVTSKDKKIVSIAQSLTTSDPTVDTTVMQDIKPTADGKSLSFKTKLQNKLKKFQKPLAKFKTKAEDAAPTAEAPTATAAPAEGGEDLPTVTNELEGTVGDNGETNGVGKISVESGGDSQSVAYNDTTDEEGNQSLKIDDPTVGKVDVEEKDGAITGSVNGGAAETSDGNEFDTADANDFESPTEDAGGGDAPAA